MALTVTHARVSAEADDPSRPELIQPSDWNDSHTVTGKLDLEVDPSVRGSSFTLAGADFAYDLLLVGSGSDIVVTIPTNATVALDTGSRITVQRTGSGRVTVAAAGGVTLRTPTGATAEARDQYSSITLIKTAANTWLLAGDLKPSASASALVIGSANRTSTVSIPNITWTTISMQSEYHDDASIWDVANPSRFLMPAGKTWFELMINLSFASASGGIRAARVKDQSGNFILGGYQFPGGTNVDPVHVRTEPHKCSGITYVEVEVYQDSGGAINLQAATPPHYYTTSITLIGY